MSEIATIGYEGASIDSFIAALVAAGIAHVIDIRDVPASRKKGFSKNALSAALADASIRYTHIKALGDPKAGREAMRRGDFDAFLTIYTQHVSTADAQQSLNDAAAIAIAEPAVLLCFERDPRHCHRTLVAERLADLADLRVRHLGANSVSLTRSKLNHEQQRAVAVF